MRQTLLDQISSIFSPTIWVTGNWDRSDKRKSARRIWIFLAKQGMKLTQHYCGNAVCAPSRCVLMTGLHPGHAHVRDNSEMQPEGQKPIPDSTVTLAELLKAEGYATGAFGKWGLGGPGSEGEPLHQGFDRFFGYNCQRHAHSYYPDYLWSDNERIPLHNTPPIPDMQSSPTEMTLRSPQLRPIQRSGICTRPNSGGGIALY